MAKSVTDGQDPEQDLEKPEPISAETHTAIDQALNEAGVFDALDNPPEPEKPPGEGEKPPGASPEAGALEPEKPPGEALKGADAPEPEKPPGTTPEAGAAPAAVELTEEEKEQKRVEALETLDLEKINPPRDISPANVVNFSKLREVAQHYKGKVSKLEEQLTQVSQASASPKVPDEILKELEEHRNFRKIFDAENDPAFKAQFNDKIKGYEDDIINILAKNGLPEATVTKLKEVGLGHVPSAWWRETIFPKLDEVDADRIRRRLGERLDVIDQKDKEVAKFSTQREEYLKQREQDEVKHYETHQKAVYDHLEKLTKDIPWAKPVEIVATFTPQQKKAAEEHNANLQVLSQRFQDALFPATPQARAEIAAAAVASTKLAQDVQALGERLKAANAREEALRQELDAIKANSRPPGSSTAHRPPAKDKEHDLTSANISDSDAVEQGLAAAEAAL